MSTFWLWLLISKTTIFTVAAYQHHNPPLLVSEELGCSPTLSVLFLKRPDGYYFDPLRLANDVNFSRFREAELKHGRISMLAVVATTIPPMIHTVVDWIPTNYPTGILQALESLQPLQQQNLLSPIDLVKVIVTCGILETLVFVQRNPTDMPGDYGVGYFGLRDKGLHEAALISELEHGRLAMLAFATQIALEYYRGSIFLWQLS